MHVRLGEEQPQRDLRGAEATERLEREHQPRVARHRLVAADEQHSQQVVTHLGIEARRQGLIARFTYDAFEDPRAPGVVAQRLEHVIVRDAVEPRRGVVGLPFRDPRGQGCLERGLHGILHEVDVPHAEPAREDRDESPVLEAEEVLDFDQWEAISRISTHAPGLSIPGIAFTTVTAPS